MRSFALALVFLATFSAACARARAETSSGAEVNTRLRAAMVESEKQLGQLEPWQKKIFEEEAVPQFQRFIRDYRAQAGTKGGITADIDLENLKNYLRFYAPQVLNPATGNKSEKPLQAVVFLRAEKDCDKCASSAILIKKLVKARIERRGLVPVWVTAAELAPDTPESELSGKMLDSKVEELAARKGAAASLVLQWQVAPIDDIDSAHADEKRYLIHSELLVRDSARELNRSEGRMEILENDSFENAAARLLTDAFTELGSKVGSILAAHSPSAGADSGAERPETWIEVSGIRSFSQYSSARSQIQAKLGVGLEERKVSKGRAVFALAGGRSADALKAQLAGLQIEGGNLGYVGAGESGGTALLQMEIR